ncbi:MAG: hypothetical protein J6V07_04050 [Clostridia bacterium]|nr:hypothetical protein [Clostridia bacterium]
MTYKQTKDRVLALQRELMDLDMQALTLFRKVKDKSGFGPRDACGVLQNLHRMIQNRHRMIRAFLPLFEGRAPGAECDEAATSALREIEEALARYRKDYAYALARSRT